LVNISYKSPQIGDEALVYMVKPNTKRTAGGPNRKAKTARILLVDAHPVIRAGLAHIFRGAPDLVVCSEADDSFQALRMAQVDDPDLAIIGMLHREAHGLELVKVLHATCPRVKILVLAMQNESVNAERAIRAGASGYISKEAPTFEILEATRRVARGEICLSQRIAAQMVATLAGQLPEPVGFTLDELSSRELEILGLLGDGLARRQIAERLHLDVNTVETYRVRLREKLRIKDAAELRQYAVQLKRAKSSKNVVVPEFLSRYSPPVSSSGGPRLGLV